MPLAKIKHSCIWQINKMRDILYGVATFILMIIAIVAIFTW